MSKEMDEQCVSINSTRAEGACEGMLTGLIMVTRQP